MDEFESFTGFYSVKLFFYYFMRNVFRSNFSTIKTPGFWVWIKPLIHVLLVLGFLLQLNDMFPNYPQCAWVRALPTHLANPSKVQVICSLSSGLRWVWVTWLFLAPGASPKNWNISLSCFPTFRAHCLNVKLESTLTKIYDTIAKMEIAAVKHHPDMRGREHE